MSTISTVTDHIPSPSSCQTISTLNNDYYYYGSNILVRGGNQEMEKNNFLEIKRKQEQDAIDKEYKIKEKEILKEDIIQKILERAEEEINEIYKTEERTIRIDLNKNCHMTKENYEKIEELKKEKTEKEDEIIDKYKEIEALVEEMLPKDKIEIYKMYNII